VRFLATSHKPLRAAGEWLLRLPALEVPSGTAERQQKHWVELFSQRAMATMEGFVLSDTDVPDALEICRRLDGMPFALELAAALEDRLAVLTRGRRTALAHHQTLRGRLVELRFAFR
jgi:predicted ATPase